MGNWKRGYYYVIFVRLLPIGYKATNSIHEGLRSQIVFVRIRPRRYSIEKLLNTYPKGG